MGSDSGEELYPYSRNRVILNAVVTVLSLFLALALLASEPIFLLYYVAATAVFTALAFVLKKRFYRKLFAAEHETKNEGEMRRTSWRTILMMFVIMVLFLTFPLLLAGLLSGSVWFIVVVSFTTGISLSEVVIYLRSRQQK